MTREAFGLLLTAALLTPTARPNALSAQLPADWSDLSGEELYQASCASCHGPTGQGLDRSLVGFEEALPDFTDCDFAAREPDADWVAVAHEGGPVRGFSPMMPAFRTALTVEQLERVMSHIRTLCSDSDWPRGELNMPRPLMTEKAYPEDEWVVEGAAALEGPGEIGTAFVYERRFGPRSQLEVAIPFGWREVSDGDRRGSGDWTGGLGDVAVGVKHALYHDLESGTIFSLGGELVLPTGDETKGLGARGAKTEAFASFGQLLPSDGFFQAQGGLELPLYGGADEEAFIRMAVGRSFSEGSWGRSWSPILEVTARKDVTRGTPTTVDLVPQLQVSLNTRQHVLANLGVLVPTTHTTGRSVRMMVYLLLDWFDGGFFEGW